MPTRGNNSPWRAARARDDVRLLGDPVDHRNVVTTPRGLHQRAARSGADRDERDASTLDLCLPSHRGGPGQDLACYHAGHTIRGRPPAVPSYRFPFWIPCGEHGFLPRSRDQSPRPDRERAEAAPSPQRRPYRLRNPPGWGVSRPSPAGKLPVANRRWHSNLCPVHFLSRCRSCHRSVTSPRPSLRATTDSLRPADD